METLLTNEQLRELIKQRYQEAEDSGLLSRIADVARELGHDPASSDAQGNRTGYRSTYGPKYIWHDGDVEVFVDDYGRYMTVRYRDQRVLSTHRADKFIVYGPWVDIISKAVPDARIHKYLSEENAQEAEHERLLARTVLSEDRIGR